MNRQRVQELVDHLRKPETEKHFSMDEYFRNTRGYGSILIEKVPHACGTVACIAGHAMLLFLAEGEHGKPAEGFSFQGAHYRAMDWLGLTATQANDLFTPDQDEVDWDEVTAKVAAGVVENLMNTGKVEWPDEVNPYRDAD